jgi:tryptophan-rich sensory protein
MKIDVCINTIFFMQQTNQYKKLNPKPSCYFVPLCLWAFVATFQLRMRKKIIAQQATIFFLRLATAID